MGRWMWVLIFMAFLGVGVSSLDPDYGWHVAMGKYILEKGIPVTDPFSYTMPSYPFVDHEWLLNTLMYLGDISIGKNGLAVIFAVMATGALYLVPRKKGWELGVILAVGVLAFRGGVRPQVLDWLLVATLWRIWQTRYKWWLPLIFLIWVNLHGGFAIGILMWLFMLVVKQIEEWHLPAGRQGYQIPDILNWILSFLATFVNPYGWRIWWEVWMQITDHNLRGNINEWQPFFVTVEPAFWFLAVLFVMFGIKLYKDKKIVWWKTLTLLVLLLAGMSSLRHVAIFAVVVVMAIPEYIEDFWRSLDLKKVGERADFVYGLFLKIGLVISVLAVSLTIINYARGTWVYPTKAIEFLRKEKSGGRVFSEYGWGGYLIWKYPEEKVFIDGRMPSWRWLAPDRESDNAMADYTDIVLNTNYQNYFDKYDIRYLLVPKRREPNVIEKFLKKMSARFEKERKPDLIQVLVRDGWVKIYQDEVAMVYSKQQ